MQCVLSIVMYTSMESCQKKIIKTSEKACQNYYNNNLITDVFQPFLFCHAKALVKGALKYPGKTFTFQERRIPTC